MSATIIQKIRLLLILCCFQPLLVLAQSDIRISSLNNPVVSQENTLKVSTKNNNDEVNSAEINTFTENGAEINGAIESPTKDDSTEANKDKVNNGKIYLAQDINQAPEVGKHVMANMDVGSMILSLFMVLTLIFIFAVILKRFNLTPQSVNPLKVVASLSLGAKTKDRVIVVQVGEQQLLLGVSAQQITLLDKLSAPIVDQSINPTPLPKSVLSFLAAKKT